jgi:hypothetical protein
MVTLFMFGVVLVGFMAVFAGTEQILKAFRRQL